MRYCNTSIGWSDGNVVVCKVDIADNQDACYLHRKYFTKDVNGGEERWRSTPSPTERKRVFDRASTASYIEWVSNPQLGMTRPIHDENTD